MKQVISIILSIAFFLGNLTGVYAQEDGENYDGRYMHISFDDVYACLYDITQNNYNSVFDNHFFADLKTYHDTYGAVFTLNCFNTETSHPDYDISNLTNKYALELAENSGWLKFSFHAEDDQSNYGDGSNGTNTSGTIIGNAPDAIKESYDKFTKAILNATGTEKSIDTVARLGYFAGTETNVKALMECNYGITGLLGADDTRVSYYLNSSENNKLLSKGRFIDIDHNIPIIQTQKRLEKVKDTVGTLQGFKTSSQNIIEIFTHEQNYNESVKSKLIEYLEWAKENKIGFAYAKDVLEYEMANPTSPPETSTKSTLYPNNLTANNSDAGALVNTDTMLDPAYRGAANSSAKKPAVALNAYSQTKGSIVIEFDLTMNLADYVFWIQPQKDVGPSYGFQATTDVMDITMPEALTNTNCLLTKIPFTVFGSKENKHHIKIELELDAEGMVNAGATKTIINVDGVSSKVLPSYGNFLATNFTYYARRYDNPTGSEVKTEYDKDGNIYHFAVSDFSMIYVPEGDIPSEPTQTKEPLVTPDPDENQYAADFEDGTTPFKLINVNNTDYEYIEKDSSDANPNTSKYVYGIGHNTGSAVGSYWTFQQPLSGPVGVEADFRIDAGSKYATHAIALLGSHNNTDNITSEDKILQISGITGNGNGSFDSITVNGENITNTAKINRPSEAAGVPTWLRRDSTGWLKMNAVLDFEKHIVDITITRLSTGMLVFSGEVPFLNKNVSQFSEVFLTAGKGYDGIFVDNISTYITNTEKNVIDTSDINTGGNVSKFMVYVIKDGRLSRRYETAAADEVTVNTNQGETAEIVPVYEYTQKSYMQQLTNAKDGFELPDDFDAGTRYNLTFKKADYSTSDMYVNGAMVANNVDQWGSGRTRTEGSEFTANDIKATEEGKFTIQAMDTSDAPLLWVKVCKSPSVNRKTKIYLIGDSLVCNYYGSGNTYFGSVQTGLGQQLENFISDDYEVINLGNSGYYAKNMYDTSFAGVIAHGEAGDILLFEAGYNDCKYSTETEMIEYAGKIMEEAKAAGINIIALNPNATPEQMKAQVQWGQIMLDTAAEKGVPSIDLSTMSYNYITRLYGSDKDKLKSSLALATSKDDCHSSFVGAMKYASIIAHELYNMGYESAVNTEYTYIKTDNEGNEIICNALIGAPQTDGGYVSEFIFGKNAQGQGVILTNDKYEKINGYGFENTSDMTVNENSVTSLTDYTFKIKADNGNYTVKMNTSAEQVTSEILDVASKTGLTKNAESFDTAVIDGILDVTVPAGQTLSGITIEKHGVKTAQTKPGLYTIGDSTSNIRQDPQRAEAGCMSWGNTVEKGFVTLPSNIGTYHNYGYAGADSVRFYNYGQLERVLLDICPGDYVTVNMGINSKEQYESSSYDKMIKYYIDGIKERGGIPVILTHTPQQPSKGTTYDDSTGMFSCSMNAKMRCPKLISIAGTENIDVIDIGTYVDKYFNQITEEQAKTAGFDTPFDMISSWYYDEIHYKQPLGEVLAEYILKEISAKIGETEPNPNRIISFDGSQVKVSVQDIGAVLYTASYERNGQLKQVDLHTFERAGEYSLTLQNQADKAMLWDSGMRPYDSKEVSREAE
jgi:lysophospholipase L1-like esterase